MTDLSDLRKRAEEIEAASAADRKAMAMLLRDLIARLDDADNRGAELVREQTERRIGLRR